MVYVKASAVGASVCVLLSLVGTKRSGDGERGPVVMADFLVGNGQNTR